RGGISLTVRNSLFTRSDYGLYVREGATYVTEGYNGFWANTTNYYPGPLAQTDKPLGIGECPYQWTAGDPADERSTWYLEQDPALLMDEGDGTPEANGLSGFSTSRLGAWDQANVDIGYHYYHYADTDSDGIPDNWEYQYCPQGQNWVGEWSSGLDPDNDGLTNYEEFLIGTEPTGDASWDSDADGLPDGLEVRLPTANGPLQPDSGYSVIYVDRKNTGGQYGTYEQPYTLIQTAVDNSQAGYIVFVLPSTYTQSRFPRLSVNKSITLLGNGAERTVIDGGPDQVPAGNENAVVNVTDAAEVTIKAFTIQRGFNEQHWIYGSRGHGGALRCEPGCALELEDCIVAHNLADYGAGIYSAGEDPGAGDGNLHLTNCIIANNAATSGNAGGGIYISGGILDLNQCAVVGNIGGDKEEPGTLGGGGIYSYGCSPTVAFSLIGHNAAREGWGGVPSNGGGMAIVSPAGFPVIKNCVIRDNRAYNHGGGIYLFNIPYRVDVYNSIISGNSGGGGQNGGGGGVYMTGSEARLVNCTIAGSAPCGIESYILYPEAYNLILWDNAGNDIEGNCPVSYSDIEEWITGPGNIHVDPEFVFTGRGPYHIGPLSPCVDAAYQTVPAECGEADVDGDPRSIPPQNHIDMGADEVDRFAVIAAICANENDPGGLDITWNSTQGREYRVYFSSEASPDRPRWTKVASVTASGVETTWTDTEAYPGDYGWGFYKIAEVDGGDETLSEPVGFVSVDVARSATTVMRTAFSVPLETRGGRINDDDGPGKMIVDCLPPGVGSSQYDYSGETNYKITVLHELYAEAPLDPELRQSESDRWLYRNNSNPSDPRNGKWLTEPTELSYQYNPPDLELTVDLRSWWFPERQFLFLDQTLVGTTIWVEDEYATVAAVLADPPDYVTVILGSPLLQPHSEGSAVCFEAVDAMRPGRSFVLTLRGNTSNPNRVTFFGYLPLPLFQATPFGYSWTITDDPSLQDFEVSFAFPYSILTNLNAVPFRSFGALPDDPYDPAAVPDRIKVWPLYASGWQELWLRRRWVDPNQTLDDGTCVWMSGPTPANAALTALKPGSGFRFVTATGLDYVQHAVTGRSKGLKYMVTRCPYD
ncbi:MAG: hypothetical protein Q8Q12_01855, partial [bacterium]|nr:hypothetical protein [bacterium]